MTLIACPLFRVFNACDEHEANAFAHEQNKKGYAVGVYPFEALVRDPLHNITLNIHRIKVVYSRNRELIG